MWIEENKRKFENGGKRQQNQRMAERDRDREQDWTKKKETHIFYLIANQTALSLLH